jgi:hypothetical protein
MDASEEVFQLVEVKRRIAEVESGRVELVPGDEVLVRARQLLAALSDEDEWVTEALRRDAEIEGNASAAISLAELDSYTQSRRKCVRAADDRE